MKIDFTNMKKLRSLMDRADEFDEMLMGRNENGEFVTTSILKDKIIAETLQDNDWVRRNIYWYDGTTEELYSKDGDF